MPNPLASRRSPRGSRKNSRATTSGWGCLASSSEDRMGLTLEAAKALRMRGILRVIESVAGGLALLTLQRSTRRDVGRAGLSPRSVRVRLAGHQEIGSRDSVVTASRCGPGDSGRWQTISGMPKSGALAPADASGRRRVRRSSSHHSNPRSTVAGTQRRAVGEPVDMTTCSEQVGW